ncbi:MAG: PAC2 family protein [Candidatus Micrarchaeia archaeon]
MSNESRIVEHSNAKYKNALLIVGVPGIGLVSKLAVDHAARELKAKRVATLYSPNFPNQTIALPNGRLKALTIKINHCRVKNNDVLFARGDLQPFTVEGQYEVAFKLLDYAKRIGATRAVSMAGYAVEKPKAKPDAYCAASNPKLFAEYAKKCGLKKPLRPVPIIGMAGLVPALAPVVGMEGACILVETNGSQIDADGAKRLVEIISTLAGAKIPLKGVAERAEKIRKSIVQAQPQQQQQAVPVIETQKSDLSYIR